MVCCEVVVEVVEVVGRLRWCFSELEKPTRYGNSKLKLGEHRQWTGARGKAECRTVDMDVTTIEGRKWSWKGRRKLKEGRKKLEEGSLTSSQDWTSSRKKRKRKESEPEFFYTELAEKNAGQPTKPTHARMARCDKPKTTRVHGAGPLSKATLSVACQAGILIEFAAIVESVGF